MKRYNLTRGELRSLVKLGIIGRDEGDVYKVKWSKIPGDKFAVSVVLACTESKVHWAINGATACNVRTWHDTLEKTTVGSKVTCKSCLKTLRG